MLRAARESQWRAREAARLLRAGLLFCSLRRTREAQAWRKGREARALVGSAVLRADRESQWRAREAARLLRAGLG